ncbi:hypothetical protein R84B8_01647 [Treponema sp. R8-4-B8]
MTEDEYSFVNIKKYQDTVKKTQLENYTTELFIFMLRYLKTKKNKILSKILKEFGFYGNLKYNKIIISSQCKMEVNKIPDILIEYNKKKIVIEVKIDSNLNTYQIKNKVIDQIEYYKKIKGIDKVYLLTKRLLTIKNIENRILWSKIYTIINCENDFILKNFARHLEENGMATYRLTNDIFNALSSIVNLSSLLIDSWIYDKYEKFSVSPIEVSKKRGWLACYIKNTKKENLFWLGLTDEKILYAELLNKKYLKILEDKKYKYIEGWAFDKLNLSDIVNMKTYEEQANTINKWYLKIMTKLEKNISS